MARETDCSWLDDVTYPWDIISLNATVLRQAPSSLGGYIEKGAFLKGPVTVGSESVIRSNCYIAGPVVIGTGCEIGPNAVILPATSIGDNVIISSFCEINNSVIGNDVSVGPGCIIQDSVIDKGCIVGGRFTALSGNAEIKVEGEHHLVNVGTILGEECILSSGVIAQPGTIIGNSSEVRAMRLLSGRVPDHSLIL
jgi:glucose-1-phosphate thymidylyltransferase